VGLLAVRARDHAVGHAGGRLMVEHGREPATDPEAADAGRSAPRVARPDHRVVRGGRAALGCGPDALRVGRQARGWAATATGATPSRGRLGRLHPITAPTPGRVMATGKPSDPLAGSIPNPPVSPLGKGGTQSGSPPR